MNSRRANLIIALICSIALWMYVVGETNPSVHDTYQDIPIKFTNVKVLENRGLAVSSTSETEMSVTIAGKRNAVNKVKEGDIKATVDLSDAALGSNRLVINIDVPNNVHVTRQSIENVRVKIERRISEYKTVKAIYTGNSISSEEPTQLGADPHSVLVTGAKSRVNKVKYVRAEIPITSLGTSVSSSSRSLVPVDSSGNKVSNVDMDRSRATITSVLYQKKTVPLKVKVKGNNDSDYQRSYDAPETVTIKGLKSDIESVDSVKADTVDLSNVYDDQEIALNVNLPDGVMLADKSRNLVMEVKVESAQKKTQFDFSGDAVTVSGLEDGYTAKILTDSVKVTITADRDQIMSITQDKISLSADVSDFSKGTHNVKVKVSVDGEVTAATASPSTVRIKIIKDQE